MKILTVTHQDVESLLNKLTIAHAGIAGEDLLFIIRPAMRISDSAKMLLRHKGIEIKRDAAAPIDSAYVMTRKDYQKYDQPKT